MRLNKYLSNCGIISRRKADNLIQIGRIKVNGKTITQIGLTIDEMKDEILLDDKKVLKPQKRRYLILNKPKLYVTSLKKTKKTDQL